MDSSAAENFAMSFRFRVFATLVILASAACGGSSSNSNADSEDRSVEGNRTLKEVSYINLQQDRIKDKLKDPASAQFRNARVYYGVAPIVCGEVNASNSFGGKNGYQRFISGGDIQVLEENMAPGEMEKLWPQVCR